MYLRQVNIIVKNQENIIEFAFTRVQCFTILSIGSLMLILNFYRNYSFKATIFLLMM